MKALGILILTFISAAAFAQDLKSSVGCDISLQIVSENGTNALGVTYDETSNRYYTAFAGNKIYPLEAFTANGEFIFTTELGIDARGFWFNSKSKCLEGLGYENMNKYSIPVNTLSGNATSAQLTIAETNSYGLEAQQVGVKCGKKEIMFVQNGSAYFFKKPLSKGKIVSLKLNSSSDVLNQISPIYTGVKGKEIGLFNAEEMSVEFYSASNGAYSGKVRLDYSACSDEIDSPYSFRFAYANNKVWVYDTYSRSWLGFSIWN